MAPPDPTLVSLLSLALSLFALTLVAVVMVRARRAERGTKALTDRLASMEVRQMPPPARRGATATPRVTTRAHSTEAPAPTLISVPNLSAPAESGVSAEASAVLGQRFSTVWELADAGASAESIARATGHPAGQVELILGLRRQVAAPASASVTVEGRPWPS